MKKLLLFFICVWIGQLSYAQNILSGTVLDANDEPLPGATVSLLDTDRITATDADGFFLFQRLEKGMYTLEVNYVGFQALNQTISVDGRTDVDLSLKEDTYTTSTAVVSATRVRADAPVTHSNLSKEELEKNNLGQDVPFLLKWSPSLVVTSDAGAGIGYTGIRVRGSDPTRVNVTINGIPLNDAESQGVFWVDLPDFVSSTDDIQIQRGVGTSTNGAGAFGATINLSTSQKNDEFYLQTDHSFGSFNTYKGNVQFGSGLLGNRFTIDGRLSHIQSDGYIDRASSDLDSYFFTAGYWGDNNSLVFNAFSGHEVTYQAWNGVPQQYGDIDSLRTFNTAGMERADEPHDNEVDDYTQSHYQLIYNQGLTNDWNLQTALHYTRGKGFFEQYKAAQDLADYGISPAGTSDLVRRRWLDNHFYGLTFSLQRAVDNLDVTIGGAANNYLGRHFGEVIESARDDDYDTPPIYYDNDAVKFDANIYAKAIYQINSTWSAFGDLQYRYINYQFTGLDAEANPLDQTDQLNFVNPKAGLTYTISNNAQFYGFVGVAQREPNRNDYTETSLTSRPESEFMVDYELGYRFQNAKTRLSANGYFMDYTNQLVLTGQLNDVGEYSRVNVADSYRLGIELESAFALTDDFTLAANATFSDNKVGNFTEYIDNWDTWGQETIEHSNTNLAFSPAVIASASLSYNLLSNVDNQNLEISLLNKYVGKQYIDNTSNENTTLDPYFYSDFRVRYELNTSFLKRIAVTLLVRNVFDAQYSANAWTYRFQSEAYNPVPDDPYAASEGGNIYNLTGLYPQAGRNFLLGLSLRF